MNQPTGEVNLWKLLHSLRCCVLPSKLSSLLVGTLSHGLPISLLLDSAEFFGRFRVQIEPNLYDAETLALVGHAYDRACLEFLRMFGTAASEMNSVISLRILRATAAGERDPARLASIALAALDG